jgi:hypothetical protein
MSDQIVTNPTTTEKPAGTPTEAAKTGQPTVFTQEQVDQIIKNRLEQETAKREKALAAERTKAEQDALAKNAEWQKLAEQRQAELDKIKAELTTAQLNAIRQTVAARVGIPPALAGRLIGNTAEEIEADAKALLETLPKPSKPQPGPVTNPGNGAGSGETLAQQRARIHGQGPGAWDPAFLRSKGGGVGE